MTTVVITPRMIVADTTINDNGTAFFSRKVARIKHDGAHSIIAGAGSLHVYKRAIESHMENMEKFDPNLKDYTDIVRLDKAGKMFVWDNMGCVESEIQEKFWAVGSGRDLALGALAMGATEIEAIQIACRYDMNSGGAIFGWERAKCNDLGFIEVHA
jgi:hypothetical protein